MNMSMEEVLNWIILIFVVGLGVEVKKLKAEIRRLKDELSQKNVS